MHKLRWSDIWILVSIYVANQNNETRIHNFVAVADRISHAIPNVEEFESALVRLSERGYIKRVRNWNFICTQEGQDLVSEAESRNSLAFKVCKELESRLGVTPWTPPEELPHPENNLNYSQFTKEMYDKEVTEYLRIMKE